MLTVVIDGFFVGLIYALFGVGLVVIYRGSRVINFAFGETGMISAFVFADLWAGQRRPLLLCLLAALALAMTLGAATERIVARPLRNEPRLVTMVGTLAVQALLLVYATGHWGLNPRFVPPLIQGGGVRLADLTIQPEQLLILGVAGALLAGLGALYRFTSFGLRLRATAIDPAAAAQVGINTDHMATATWALGGLLAAIAAILIAPLVAFHVYFMTLLAVPGIAAALVGGLTSLWGAAMAGVLLGIAEGVIGYVTPVGGTVDLFVSAFIILMLLVRPTGLVRSAY